MWNRFLLAAITILQIQPALGADRTSANVDGAVLRLYQFRDGALLLKPEYGAADKPVASLAPSEWAVAYQVRGDAGITPRLRREGVYRWTETQVTRISNIQIAGMPNWFDVPDGGGVFVGFDYGLK